MVLKPTSNPKDFTALAKSNALSKFWGSTARRTISTNPTIGFSNLSKSAGSVFFSLSITTSFLVQVARKCVKAETGVYPNFPIYSLEGLLR